MLLNSYANACALSCQCLCPLRCAISGKFSGVVDANAFALLCQQLCPFVPTTLTLHANAFALSGVKVPASSLVSFMQMPLPFRANTFALACQRLCPPRFARSGKFSGVIAADFSETMLQQARTYFQV